MRAFLRLDRKVDLTLEVKRTTLVFINTAPLAAMEIRTMSTLHHHIDPKQLAARADYATSSAKAALDDAIDADESRDELIAQRAHEIELRRLALANADDMVAGFHSAVDANASAIRAAFVTGDLTTLGRIADVLIRAYIKADSEVESIEWMERIEREAGLWSES